MLQPKSKSIAGLLLLVGACMIWGSSFAIGKLAVDQMGAVETTVLRFLLASAIFLVIIGVKKSLPERRDIWLMLVIAFCTVPGTFLLQFYGLAMTSASHAAIMIGMEPVVITFMAWLFLKDRIHTKDIYASVMAFIGVAVVSLASSDNSSLLGDGLVLLSTISVAIWVLLSKKMMGRYSPLLFTAYIMTLGTLMLIPFLLMMPTNLMGAIQNSSQEAQLSVLFLAIFCTVIAGLMWNFGLKIYPTHQAGISLSLEPLAGVILGIVLLNEDLSARIVVGCVLVCAATILATLKATPKQMAS